MPFTGNRVNRIDYDAIVEDLFLDNTTREISELDGRTVLKDLNASALNYIDDFDKLVPQGGVTEQILVKRSNIDWDDEWMDLSGLTQYQDLKNNLNNIIGGISGLTGDTIIDTGLTGGTTFQVLTKLSNVDYDYAWLPITANTLFTDYITNEIDNIFENPNYYSTINEPGIVQLAQCNDIVAKRDQTTDGVPLAVPPSLIPQYTNPLKIWQPTNTPYIMNVGDIEDINHPEIENQKAQFEVIEVSPGGSGIEETKTLTAESDLEYSEYDNSSLEFENNDISLVRPQSVRIISPQRRIDIGEDYWGGFTLKKQLTLMSPSLMDNNGVWFNVTGSEPRYIMSHRVGSSIFSLSNYNNFNQPFSGGFSATKEVNLFNGYRGVFVTENYRIYYSSNTSSIAYTNEVITNSAIKTAGKTSLTFNTGDSGYLASMIDNNNGFAYCVFGKIGVVKLNLSTNTYTTLSSDTTLENDVYHYFNFSMRVNLSRPRTMPVIKNRKNGNDVYLLGCFRNGNPVVIRVDTSTDTVYYYQTSSPVYSILIHNNKAFCGWVSAGAVQFTSTDDDTLNIIDTNTNTVQQITNLAPTYINTASTYGYLTLVKHNDYIYFFPSIGFIQNQTSSTPINFGTNNKVFKYNLNTSMVESTNLPITYYEVVVKFPNQTNIYMAASFWGNSTTFRYYFFNLDSDSVVLTNGTTGSVVTSSASGVSSNLAFNGYTNNNHIEVVTSNSEATFWGHHKIFYSESDFETYKNSNPTIINTMRGQTTFILNGDITSYITTENNSIQITPGTSTIKTLTITENEPAGTLVRYLTSFDGRNTWKYWNGSSFQTATTDLSSFDFVANSGMTNDNLEIIDGFTDLSLVSIGSPLEIDFAFLFVGLEGSTNTSSFTSLEIVLESSNKSIVADVGNSDEPTVDYQLERITNTETRLKKIKTGQKSVYLNIIYVEKNSNIC